jgi:hypothetical protein
MQVLNRESADIIRNQLDTEGADDGDKVIFEGSVTSRGAAAEEITRRQVESRNTFFDPQDLIDEIANSHLKYELRQSVAWALDMQCISQARDLFYRMRATKADSIDDFNEFINDIAEIKANESYNVDLGFEENTGTLRSLSMLLVLRTQWHDKAETAAKVVGTKYAPRTLEELMASEKPRTLNEDTSLNLETLAKAMTRKNPERFETVHQLLIKQQANTYTNQHKTKVLTAPAVVSIFNVAEYRNEFAEVAFHELGKDLQVRMTQQVKAAAERAVVKLANWKGVTTAAYAMLTVEAFDLMDALDAMIAKFES